MSVGVTRFYYHFFIYFVSLLLSILPVIAKDFMLGVDVFLQGYTSLVEGERVGLITNQTGRTANGQRTIDALFQNSAVHLVAIFAPEHGIEGTISAGKNVSHTVDAKTKLPVYSLYHGNKHHPSKEAIDRIDTFIYDIQDVGSRAYTYIWSMAESMKAAAKYRKKFMVFDRPNPLTLSQIDGAITEKKWLSFIGLYPIPRVYGMTAGELARYLNKEYHFHCHLVVIPMARYQRDTSWEQTQLSWIPPSPNIPSLASAQCFAATGTIGTLGNVHIGIGTDFPFQIIGAPWFDSEHAVNYFGKLNLPGIHFKEKIFFPKKGLFKGKKVRSIKIVVDDAHVFLPSTTELYLLDYLQTFYQNTFHFSANKRSSFDKAMGTSVIRESLMKGKRAEEILAPWRKNLLRFKKKIAPYLIYH